MSLHICADNYLFVQLPKPSTSASAEGETAEEEGEQVPDDIHDFYDKLDKEDEDDVDLNTVSFEVIQEQIEVLQKRSVYTKTFPGSL